MTDFQIRRQGDRYFLVGSLDHRARLDDLLKVQGDLALDLREVDDVSSIGTRIWLLFIEAWGSRRLTLYGCPPPVVSLFNAIPHAIGESRDPDNVKSVMFPFGCDVCREYREIELNIQELVRNGHPDLPLVACDGCGQPMTPSTLADDYFVFLFWKRR